MLPFSHGLLGLQSPASLLKKGLYDYTGFTWVISHLKFLMLIPSESPSSLRAFALAFFTAWNAFPPEIHMAYSFTHVKCSLFLYPASSSLHSTHHQLVYWKFMYLSCLLQLGCNMHKAWVFCLPCSLPYPLSHRAFSASTVPSGGATEVCAEFTNGWEGNLYNSLGAFHPAAR